MSGNKERGVIGPSICYRPYAIGLKDNVSEEAYLRLTTNNVSRVTCSVCQSMLVAEGLTVDKWKEKELEYWGIRNERES